MISLNDLKQKFEFTGVDVEQLIDDWYNLLVEYDHPVSKYGIMATLKRFIEVKEPLLRIIVASPYYNKNLQIVVPEMFTRKIVANDVYSSVNRFNSTVFRDNFWSKKDDSGLTLQDHIKKYSDGLSKTMKLSEIETYEFKPIGKIACFDNNGINIASKEKWNFVCKLLSLFNYYYESSVSEDLANRINTLLPDAKVVKGMKTSRAFNRVFMMVGANDTKFYKKNFPLYADQINPVETNRAFVISLNPIDYLTASFGNTWASCHTIDKKNKRKRGGEHYSGMNCGGTLSYMLDAVSIVVYSTYTAKSEDNEVMPIHPERLDKIYRCMMHYKDGYLLQGRVYPQDTDGSTDLYSKMRNAFQREWSTCLGVGNSWVKKSGYSGMIRSKGVHYRDYEAYYASGNCNMSYLKYFDLQDANAFQMLIGSDGICQYSGETYSSKGVLSNPYAELPYEVENTTTILP